LNRGDLLHDLRETVRQLRSSLDSDEPSRSVKTIVRDDGGRRKLSNRLTDDQVRELVAAFEAGTTRLELAERYGIGRTSVAKLLRQWRGHPSQDGAA
jgi:predicted DNA binding protein